MTYMPRFIPSDKEYSTDKYTEAQLLGKRSREGLSRILASQNHSATELVYIDRLTAELKIINDKSFSSYFLIVADYVSWAKDNNIAVGPGRGSGPCSLVGYALGITSIDPIKYQLPFERFLNPERESLPDFDLEFCGNRRDEVTSYLQSKYGADRVAQLVSSESIPLPSRLIIGDRSLDELVTLTSNEGMDIPTANLTVAQSASTGFVQFNVINEKSVTKIQHVLQALDENGIVVDIDTIPLDDSHAFQLLISGDKPNIPVHDSNGYKTTLVAVQPHNFAELCAVIALSYCRSESHLAVYMDRKQNPESIPSAHPAFQRITAETYGCILYQEQVMQIAQEIAGFTLAQGDLLRRTLKDSCADVDETYQKKFIEGAMRSNLEKDEAADLLEKISLQSPYFFNKSHAVCYALIAYQSAWLEANYPDEFHGVTA